MSRTRLLAAAAALGTLAACDRAPTAPAAPAASLAPSSLSAVRAAAPTASFNPQPDPPRVVRFQAVVLGAKSGGTFGAGGRIEIRTVSEDRGLQASRVVQVWTFVPPDPCLPPDPCKVPVRARLDGAVNLRSGLIALDGLTDAGVSVSVRATGGPASAAGEVMFNPQPDPPRAPKVGG